MAMVCPDIDTDIDPKYATGMAYFPGYAIDVESGKRLNIFFGENSTYSLNYNQSVLDVYDIDASDFIYEANGRDMTWNPNAQITLDANTLPYVWYFGGQHCIYVTDQEYDECKTLHAALSKDNLSDFAKAQVLAPIQWTTIPVLQESTTLLSYADGLIPNEATIQLRVQNPFAYADKSGNHNGRPTYQFEIENAKNDAVTNTQQLNTALDKIRIVPNPFYAFSDYERTETAVVKITNLPPKCDVYIYDLSGRLVRYFNRNEAVYRTSDNLNLENLPMYPDLEWDTRNQSGHYINSGMYIVHIDAGELGERALKWLAIQRE